MTSSMFSPLTLTSRMDATTANDPTDVLTTWYPIDPAYVLTPQNGSEGSTVGRTKVSNTYDEDVSH